MSNSKTYINIEDLCVRHNKLVKKEWECNFMDFEYWLEDEGNFKEKYIEIPSHQTKSGHAERLDW